MNSTGANSAWFDAMTAIGRAGDRFVAEMEARGNSVGREEIVQTMLGLVMDTYLNQIAVDPEKPTFVPSTGYFQRLGFPNPDTVYRATPIDPAGTYRLTGKRGDARDVTIMPFTREMRSSRPFDLTPVSNRGAGAFDFILSAERPEGYEGDWWQLLPDTASIWLREVSERWGEERAARISIVRLDLVKRPESAQRDLDGQLASLATRVENINQRNMLYVDRLVEDGFVNRLQETDYSKLGGMPLQFYHECVYDIPDGQCLLIECSMSPECRYFSWSMTDCMLVTRDWMNGFASLNSAQASIDPDGVLRVIVSETDPQSQNWMETHGHRYGVLQLRSIGSETAPEFTLKLIPREAVFDHLPKDAVRVGAEERRSRLHERQKSWQLRRLW